jgi:hypothetical protein
MKSYRGQVARACVWSMVGLAGLAGTAFGDVAADSRREELEQLGKRMPGLAPDPGRDKAPVRPAPWCDGIKQAYCQPLAISAAYETAKHEGFGPLIEAARYSCVFTSAPEGQLASAMVEQAWINLTGLSEADAVESISARVHADTWEADHQKLCEGLPAPDREARGEDVAFMKTRRALFGCPGNAKWIDRADAPSELLAFADQSDVPADELVRLARMLERASEPLNSTNVDHRIVGYAIDAFDYHGLPSFTWKVLNTPPFAGNRYARVVVKETIGRTKLGIAAVEAEVKKRLADADWKELLVTAPQRRVEAYAAEAQTYAAQIQRSNAFEHKAFGVSKRAAAGCLPELRKDFVEVYKKLPHASAMEARESLSDPVAALLFGRLLVCMGMDGDEGLATKIRMALEPDVRRVRGVRTVAYFAALEALGKIRADRERFPIAPTDLQWAIGDLDLLHELMPNKTSSFDYEGNGVVKSVNKVAGGLHVTFVTAKHQEMSRSCVPTGRIVQIRSDGTIQYYQSCHDTGLITVNDTPEEITIPPLLADGVKPGVAIEFAVTGGHKLERMAMPRVVYADKTKKQVVSFFGFAF